MKEQKVEVTVNKEKHEVSVYEYETFDELISKESAQDILDCFNIRHLQLQKQAEKKRLKPRHIPLKEKRAHAFNMFTEDELKETKGDSDKFEKLLKEKLKIVEQKIIDKEII